LLEPLLKPLLEPLLKPLLKPAFLVNLFEAPGVHLGLEPLFITGAIAFALRHHD